MNDHQDIKTLYEKLDNYDKLCYNIKSKEDTIGDIRLRPYQRVDVEFLEQRTSAAVFNEQRTGKTPTVLIATKDRTTKGIIVCPAGLRLNWQNEIKTWLNEDSIVIGGTKIKRKKLYKAFEEESTKYLIISYETLRSDIELFTSKFDTLIVDEAHRLRNYKTQQSKAVYKLGAKAKSVFPMTGTPAVNHPSDVFGILKLLRPKKYSSYWNFIDRYFGYIETRFGKELLGFKKKRFDEIMELISSVSVQRKRRDVMQWIPAITRRTIDLEISSTQNKYYNQVLREFRYEDNDIPNAIAQLVRLRQVCLETSLLDLKQSSPKQDFIVEYIKDNPNETVLVFSLFTSFLYTLHEKFPDAVLLTGRQTLNEKQNSVDQIQSGNAKLIFSNIIAGGTGWTLDEVDTIIFTDKSYAPTNNEQAEDRIVPTREHEDYKAKQIISLVMKNTIEGNIEELLKMKVNIVKFVNDYGLNSLVNLDEIEYNKLQPKE